MTSTETELPESEQGEEYPAEPDVDPGVEVGPSNEEGLTDPPPVEVIETVLEQHDHPTTVTPNATVYLHTDAFGVREIFWVDPLEMTLRRRWQTPQHGWCFDHDDQGVEVPIIENVDPYSGVAAHNGDDGYLYAFVRLANGNLGRAFIDGNPGSIWKVDQL